MANFVPRKVVLTAKPGIDLEGRIHLQWLYSHAGASGSDIEENVYEASSSAIIATAAGRGCYRSWDVPNEKTASPADYLKNILRQKHYSVLEHTSFTFHIENVSRAATHEIVRHRHFGFSQESQRFVLEKRGRDIVCPPLLRENEEAKRDLSDVADKAFDVRDLLVSQIRDERSDLKRKQIVEAARAVLPNAAATSLFVTGNARSWMEFIDKRDSPAADAEIREVAQEIHEQLAEAFPEVFGEEATKLWRGISNQEGVKNDK